MEGLYSGRHSKPVKRHAENMRCFLPHYTHKRQSLLIFPLQACLSRFLAFTGQSSILVSIFSRQCFDIVDDRYQHDIALDLKAAYVTSHIPFI